MEGVEGSGKSTQLQRLAARLEQLNLPLTMSREPGGTPLGLELRNLLLAPHPSGDRWNADAELLLFYADRAQHLAQVVRPGLEAGRILLLDRFDDSTRAYQGAQGVPESVLDKLSEVVLGRLRPHLTLILDLDPEVSLARVAARNSAMGSLFKETRFDEEALDFHRKVRKRFLAIAQREPHRVVLIQADSPADRVAAAIWSPISRLLRSSGYKAD